VWADGNRNGITDGGELRTLAELGIASISLAGTATDETVKAGENILLATSSFTLTDGTVRTLGDAALAYKPSAGGTDRTLSGLLGALRSGLASEGSAPLGLDLPPGMDPFDFYAAGASAGSSAKSAAGMRTQDLPRQPIDGGTDSRLALLVQDMAGFGARTGEGGWSDRKSNGAGVIDYYASH
jgi:hypothetical protein